MRRYLFTLALLLAPSLAVATEPRIHEGEFRVTYVQPQCVRAPCPGRWNLHYGEQRLAVARLTYNPATPADVRESLARMRPFEPVLVEGRVRIEGGEAMILARSYRPLPRR